jgi:hypothetical protein
MGEMIQIGKYCEREGKTSKVRRILGKTWGSNTYDSQ